MNSPLGDDSAELRRYLRVLRARKWTIVVVCMSVVAVALLFSYRQTPIYRGYARLLAEPVLLDTSGYVAPSDLNTESQLVASQPVASRVIKELGLDQSPDVLLRDVSVEPVLESEVLVVAYSSRDPALAQDGANAFARHYIQYRRERALKELLSARNSIRRKKATLQQRLSVETKRLEEARQAGDKALVRDLEADRGLVIASLGVLQQRLDDVLFVRSLAKGGSHVIEPATRPSSPSSPNYRINAVLGGAVGLILGIGAAFIRERLDDRVRSPSEVADAVGTPVLAMVPRFSCTVGKSDALKMMVTDSGGAGEAYRMLRTNVQIAMVQRNVKSILVTSPLEGEGKTITTANLGAAVARVGPRVVLVSADLRRPRLEKYLGVKNLVGLTTWLANRIDDPWEFIQGTDIPNLSLLCSGPIPPNPTELLASRRLVDLVVALQEGYDLVLFDSPSILPTADALIVASYVRHAIIVLNAASTPRSAAALAREELQRADVDTIGSVLNKMGHSASSHRYHPTIALAIPPFAN
jgi:capsular exopolysaccharide synthesis family protein